MQTLSTTTYCPALLQQVRSLALSQLRLKTKQNCRFFQIFKIFEIESYCQFFTKTWTNLKASASVTRYPKPSKYCVEASQLF